jgi:hypothetical protein
VVAPLAVSETDPPLQTLAVAGEIATVGAEHWAAANAGNKQTASHVDNTIAAPRRRATEMGCDKIRNIRAGVFGVLFQLKSHAC